MYLHQHTTHPWTDHHNHHNTRQTAQAIADDISRNHRWGAAEQPVYDLSENGRHLGDLSDDTVRCRVGGPIITVFTPTLPTPEDLAEQIYLQANPDARRWLSLVTALTAAVAAGRLTADEPIETAATRLLRNGYDQMQLTDLLPDPEPVGATEIAVRAGVERATVEQWTRRHADFPRSRWTVGGRPAWMWHEVHAWLGRTRRSRGSSTDRP